jgi:hypothetical protein
MVGSGGGVRAGAGSDAAGGAEGAVGGFARAGRAGAASPAAGSPGAPRTTGELRVNAADTDCETEPHSPQKMSPGPISVPHCSQASGFRMIPASASSAALRDAGGDAVASGAGAAASGSTGADAGGSAASARAAASAVSSIDSAQPCPRSGGPSSSGAGGAGCPVRSGAVGASGTVPAAAVETRRPHSPQNMAPRGRDVPQ